MSSAGATDAEITVSESGISIHKEFRPEDFPIPAIRFLIVSEREEPVSLQLSEDIPEEVPMEIVGFHPDYDSEHWTAFQDHHVEYERTIEPGEEVETVYGIRIDDPQEAEPFMTEPEIAAVSPEGEGVALEADADDAVDSATIDDVAPSDDEAEVSEAEAEPVPAGDASATDDDGSESGDGEEASDDAAAVDDIASPEEDEAVKDMIAEAGAESTSVADDGAAESDDGAVAGAVDADDAIDAIDAEGGDASDAEDEALDELVAESDTEPAEPAEPVPQSGPASGDGPVESTADGGIAAPDGRSAGLPGVGDHDSLAGALAAELASGDVPEADRAALRDALDADASGSVDARISHLQSRVEDVAAYADAMEEFLDEEGTANQLAEEFREDVAALESELEELSATVEATSGDVDGIETDLRGLEEDVDAVETQVRAVDDDLGVVEDDLEDVRSRIDDHDDRIGDVEGTASGAADAVDRVDEDLDHLRERLGDLEEGVDDVEDVGEDLEELRDGLDRVEDRIDALRDLEDDLDSLQSEIEEIQAWRDQLGEMFTD